MLAGRRDDDVAALTRTPAAFGSSPSHGSRYRRPPFARWSRRAAIPGSWFRTPSANGQLTSGCYQKQAGAAAGSMEV